MNTPFPNKSFRAPERTNPSDSRILGSQLPAYADAAADAVEDAEETLVVDRRAELRPSQMVELKLRALLRGKALPVSYMQMVNSIRSRN